MKKENAQQQIGYFIKQLREHKNITQKEFATMLDTSQSAIARMESGDQNFSTELLIKVSKALQHEIIQIKDSVDFKIEGGRKLQGRITTNYSKNGALGLLCASLVNKGTTLLHGIPKIEEIYRMIEVMESIGIEINWVEKNSLKVKPPKTFSLNTIDTNAAAKMRSTLMMIGALIHREQKFTLPHAGGCKMGERTIEAHRIGLSKLGVSIKTHSNSYEISQKKLKPSEIIMYEASDTGTINLLIAASLIEGTTTLRFAPPNYQVQDVCYFLESLGVRIVGIGTTTLTIHGCKEVNHDAVWWNSEDPIESMMWISASIVTDSTLTITRCPIDFLEIELSKLEYMGLKYKRSKKYYSNNNKTSLVDITLYPSKLKSSSAKIHPLPYPGLNVDNLPFFVPITTQAQGTTLIHDWMWENRAIYYTELNRLGADIKLADPHRVFVTGKTNLRSAQIVCPPALRPAMIILIAMLGADGTSILRNVYSIKRGYEDIAERLNSIGADIQVYQNL